MNLPSNNSSTDMPPELQDLVNEEDPSLLLRTELRQGSKPGDLRVRLVRPSHKMFKRLDVGILEATEKAEEPRTNWERFTTGVKRTLIGAPLATARAEHERLPKFKALAVLSSDAISSVASRQRVFSLRWRRLVLVIWT